MINKDDIHKQLRRGIHGVGWTEDEFLTANPHYASVRDINWDVSEVGPIRLDVLNGYVSHLPDFDLSAFPIFTSNTHLPWWALAATFEDRASMDKLDSNTRTINVDSSIVAL